MSDSFEYELGKASTVLVEELFKWKVGESLVITCDTESDMRVVDATARMAFAVGAKPMVIHTAAALGVARQTDSFLPVGPLRGALETADCWVEFNKQYLLYSDTWQIVTSENPGADPEGAFQAMVTQAEIAVRDDLVEVVVLGCAAMERAAQGLSERIGAPVVDPGVAGFKLAEMPGDLRSRTGLSIGRTAFGRPRGHRSETGRRSG